jgi:hypothetical protein
MEARDTTGNGSGLAASDLYGTGVRVGIYLQALGMICTCIRLKSVGLKLACSALILAVLSSWSILVARKDVSPAEAWLIISIVSILWLPASSALLCPTAVVGEAVGTVALLVATFWNAVAMCQFWSSSYKNLPLLGTSDAAFFFSKVSLKHWFRTLMFVISICQVIGTIPLIIIEVGVIKKGAEVWLQGKDELNLSRLGATMNESLLFVKISEWTIRFNSVIGILGWASGVVGAELMIKWNNLTPVSDLSLPGQSIPLAIGVIIFVDGVFGLCQPKRARKYPGLEGARISDYFKEELRKQIEQMQQP